MKLFARELKSHPCYVSQIYTILMELELIFLQVTKTLQVRVVWLLILFYHFNIQTV